jgi:hypothetical protein
VEAKVVSREWCVQVEFEPGEISDTVKKFTTMTFRPMFAYVKFAAGADEHPRFQSVIVSGYRVLKGDRLGVMVDARYYRSDGPDWLEPVIDKAREAIRG